MNIGYVRVSVKDELADRNVKKQMEMLSKYDIEKWYVEIGHLEVKERPVLQRMLEELRSGDQIYVNDLARLHRDLDELYRIFKAAEEKGVHIMCMDKKLGQEYFPFWLRK